MSRHDADYRESDYSDTGDARRPAEIEEDIARIRARMDRTLDEIEYRLSPGQMSAYAARTFQDFIHGNPNPLSDAIRRHPLPAAMIAVGAVWLGIAMLRDRSQYGHARDGEVVYRGEDVEAVLSPLITLTRQGADALRQAQAKAQTDDFRSLVTEYAEQNDRAAAALESELRRFGEAPSTGAMPPSRPHPAWSELRRALTAGDRDAILRGVESGADATMEAFRNALHQGMPEEVRVIVGAHFHAMEQMHNRISALKHATI